MNQDPPHANRRGRRQQRLAASAALLIAALTSIAFGPRSSDAAAPVGPAFRDTGQTIAFSPVARDAEDEFPASIFLDPRSGEGFKVIGSNSAATPTHIGVFNLETLQDNVRTATFPNLDFRAQPGEWAHEIGVIGDVGGGKLFLVDTNSVTRVVDQRTLALEQSWPAPLPRGATDAALTRSVGGYTATNMIIGAEKFVPDVAGPGRHKLYVLTEEGLFDPIPEKTNIVSLSQWDATDGAEEWLVALNACRDGRASAGSKYGMGLGISGPDANGLYEALIGCIARSNQGGQVWKVKFNPNDPVTPIEEGGEVQVGQVPGAIDFFPDPAGRKVFVQTSLGSQQIVGIDVDRRGAYGAVTTSFDIDAKQITVNAVGAGLDPTTGRMYAVYKGSGGGDIKPAILLLDGRVQPLPVGAEFPQPLKPGSTTEPLNRAGYTKIVVDPTHTRADGTRVPTRVFLRFRHEDFVRVYEDRLPLSTTLDVGDRDRNTSDIDEQPGVGVGVFTAASSGYGARLRVVGSPYGAVPTLANVGGGNYPGELGDVFLQSGCRDDRELVFAEVIPEGNVLSDTGVTASARPAFVDPASRQQLDGLVKSCFPRPSESATGRVDQVTCDENLASAGQIQIPNPYTVGSDLSGGALECMTGDSTLLGHLNPDEFANSGTSTRWPFRDAVCSTPGETTVVPALEGDAEKGEDDAKVTAGDAQFVLLVQELNDRLEEFGDDIGRINQSLGALDEKVRELATQLVRQDDPLVAEAARSIRITNNLVKSVNQTLMTNLTREYNDAVTTIRNELNGIQPGLGDNAATIINGLGLLNTIRGLLTGVENQIEGTAQTLEQLEGEGDKVPDQIPPLGGGNPLAPVLEDVSERLQRGITSPATIPTIAQNLGALPGYGAVASCGKDGKSYFTTAFTFHDVSIPGLIKVEGVRVDTTARKLDGGGARIETVARARGVTILPAGLTIGEIRTTAVSEAAGRPGTAKASVSRLWCGVTGFGPADALGSTMCFDPTSAQAQALISNLNERMLKSRGLEIKVPIPDDALLAGTPKGAVSGVQKDRFISKGEAIFNNDNKIAVPALELVHVNDSAFRGRRRQIIQLAGVEGTISYSVVPDLNLDFDFDFDASVADLGGGLALPAVSFVAGRDAIAPVPPTDRVLAQPAGAHSPLTGQGGGSPLEAIRNALDWVLHNPWEVLKIAMLVFTAWGLPAHLSERRRQIAAVMNRKV